MNNTFTHQFINLVPIKTGGLHKNNKLSPLDGPEDPNTSSASKLIPIVAKSRILSKTSEGFYQASKQPMTAIPSQSEIIEEE